MLKQYCLFFSCLCLLTQIHAKDLSGNPDSSIISDKNYVGTEICADCHQAQWQLWQGSHHDQAMQPANENTVLGDFNNVSFDHYGEKTLFSKNAQGFFVTTANARGEQETFKVAYTFGFYPLQQYLLPLGDGRLQALSVSWDSRPQADGGQRWFHLYPYEAIPFNDSLHWSGPYQNWNSRCAACHSTNLKRGYDAATDSYTTTWSEVNVACEACHGAGAKHVQQMQSASPDGDPPKFAGFDLSLAAVGSWLRHPGAATASHQQPDKPSGISHPQLDVCGSCHSRRTLLDDPNKPGAFHQKYTLRLLEEPLYYADGQIRDEDYVLGSFLQSKMHQRGVVCSNCHEPHSLKLRTEGNGLCAQCHNPAEFDTPQHHHHEQASAGAQCVNCHMPETTYMVVDPRRDHSLRIPRPDLSDRHGTPNACSQCHRDQATTWATEALEGWLQAQGKSLPANYSEQLLMGLRGGDEAETTLLKLAMNSQAPAIMQASALNGLGNLANAPVLLVAQTQLAHEQALVRAAAVQVLAALPMGQRLQELAPLLKDHSKQVRMAVAQQLMGATEGELAQGLSPDLRNSWQQLQAEYQQSLLRQQDTPAGQVGLGLLRASRGDHPNATRHYQRALKMVPSLAVAALNLADSYREQQLEPQGEAVLRKALAMNPEEAALHHALGLNLVRQKNYAAALLPIQQAAQLRPDEARYGYIHGVLLQHLGRLPAAQAEWQRVLQRWPQNREVLMALLAVSREQQQWPQALEYARRLQILLPEDKSLASLVAYLSQRVQ